MHRRGWLNILPSMSGRPSMVVASSPLGRAGVCRPFQPFDARAGVGLGDGRLRSFLGSRTSVHWVLPGQAGVSQIFGGRVGRTWRMGVVRSARRFCVFAGGRTMSVGLLGGSISVRWAGGQPCTRLAMCSLVAKVFTCSVGLISWQLTTGLLWPFW